MDQETFENSHATKDYIDSLKHYRNLVRRLHSEVQARSVRGDELRALLGSAAGPFRATVLTEDWCDDSACNIPVIDKLFADAQIPLGIIRMSENGRLKTRYDSLGVDRIPVLSIWDGDWKEIARWVEHPSAAEKEIEQWKSHHPDFEATRKSSAPEDQRTFRRLFKDYLDDMARAYQEGLWDETIREILERVKAETG